jgi:hypothetical protein
MATPLGHSIVGYTVARAAGVRSPGAIALAVGAANLPDVDFILGFMAHGDALSLHHEVITHRPVFPLLAAAGVGTFCAAVSLLRGHKPSAGRVLRPAALTAALVGSHVAMDPLPLPYDSMQLRSASRWEVIVSQAWNAVIDMAVYGTLAAVLFDRNGRARARQTTTPS